MIELLKKIFIPFYWWREIKKDRKNKKENYSYRHIEELSSILYGVFLSFYIIVRFSSGIYDANTANRCRVKSLASVAVSPMYTLGCNLGKDRFNIKLN